MNPILVPVKNPKVGDIVWWSDRSYSTGSQWDGYDHAPQGYKILSLDGRGGGTLESKIGPCAVYGFDLFVTKQGARYNRNLPDWW